MPNPFRYFNASPEVIRLAVMIYIRYPLFAAVIGKRRSHRRSYSHQRSRLDEVFVRINGETHYLWRAVDREAEVREVFATKRRDRGAASKFPKRTMKRYGRPKLPVTGRLRSYGAAMTVIGAVDRQVCGQWLHDRAENALQPFRRARRMAPTRRVRALAAADLPGPACLI